MLQSFRKWALRVQRELKAAEQLSDPSVNCSRAQHVNFRLKHSLASELTAPLC